MGRRKIDKTNIFFQRIKKIVCKIESNRVQHYKEYRKIDKQKIQNKNNIDKINKKEKREKKLRMKNEGPPIHFLMHAF